jgi:hypothetical protein
MYSSSFNKKNYAYLYLVYIIYIYITWLLLYRGFGQNKVDINKKKSNK